MPAAARQPDPELAQANPGNPSVTASIARTSLAVRGRHPDEVTVRFRRWHATNNTAYQKGQFAGFPSAIADRLVQGGVADVAEQSLLRSAALATMVTK